MPYGRHQIDQSDIDAVVDVLKSDWLTTGPKLTEFEGALARYAGGGHAVAVSSGTSALHCAAYAAGVTPGDEVIVPAITFAATANCVIALGGKPVIVDVEPDTLLIDTGSVEKHITSRTKAILAVEYAGQPCDYAALRALADKHHLFLISDSCHALGARYENKSIGQLADATVFSFHPVKHITTGEGGAIVVDDPELALRMRRFRNHGIDSDLHRRSDAGTWFYEVAGPGFNYRLTDFQCALGLSQLKKVEQWIGRRQAIARRYDLAFQQTGAILPLTVKENRRHAYHLYVVQVKGGRDVKNRAELFLALRDKGIGVNVHYIPLNMHPYYQRHLGVRIGQCPAAEAAYENMLSLPIFPAMSDADVDYVIETISRLIER
ncbi:UDP-4-amino-4,6-dideoxy-N-acetyl-beta-L-altrosamine transaminase [Desulfosarcina sp.]|uniref:UDP-4-amino-4, 6-dideoxy-N-acetyl-beta-L-altrosamine transaminase n=1 Tax=Desulfosarcina sp. TaxID=2027861 RepID=UPI0035652745